MKKLISNKAAEIIKAKHTEQEINNGIITLRSRKNSLEVMGLLHEKLLEEVNEYIHEHDPKAKAIELQDIIDVCLALQSKSDKFSEGWILENTR